jgi:hypothetical protein
MAFGLERLQWPLLYRSYAFNAKIEPVLSHCVLDSIEDPLPSMKPGSMQTKKIKNHVYLSPPLLFPAVAAPAMESSPVLYIAESITDDV